MNEHGGSADAVWRARELIAARREAEAVDVLRAASAAAPHDVEVLAWLSVALRTDDAAQAHSVGSRAAAMAPQLGWIQLVAAWSADAAGQHHLALAHARRALALDANDAAVHAALAQMLLSTRDHASAHFHAMTAIRLDPNSVSGWVALGNVEFRARNLTEARGSYHRALAIDPTNRAAMLNLAAVNHADGQLVSAMEQLQRVIAADPREHDARSLIDETIRDTFAHLLWLAVPIGFIIAATAQVLSGRR